MYCLISNSSAFYLTLSCAPTISQPCCKKQTKNNLSSFAVAHPQLINPLTLTLPSSHLSLCRQRPALGKCLAAFSAAFPVAFLEHQINRFNSFSIYNSRGAKDRAGAPPELIWPNQHVLPNISPEAQILTAAVSSCLSVLGLPGQVGDVCPLIPNLEKSLEEIMDLAESGMRYTQVPHVMEV